jgi:hypothetical protein
MDVPFFDSSRINDTTANHAQERIVAHWDHETTCKGCRGPAAKCQTEMMDDRLEPLGPSAVTGQNSVLELFAENATTAKDGVAPKTPRQHRQLNAPAP